MRKIIFSILFIVSATTLFSQTLNIEIDNIRSEEGQYLITYHRPDDPWLDKDFKEQELLFPKDTVTDNKFAVSINGLEPGVYSIALMDDENMDGKMEHGFLGIPKEGFGFSNNIKVRLFKPNFDECSFKLVNDTTIYISVQYK